MENPQWIIIIFQIENQGYPNQVFSDKGAYGTLVNRTRLSLNEVFYVDCPLKTLNLQ